MSNKNIKIVLFSILLYIVIMIMTTFWIIPTLVFIFKLGLVTISILSIAATMAYAVLIIRLMIYLGLRYEKNSYKTSNL